MSVDSCHLRMKPGLSASCQVIVNQVKDTIVVPSAAIFVRDSTKVVYVADGEKFIPVIIETGLTNSAFSIISKGLTGMKQLLSRNHHITLLEKMQVLSRKKQMPQINIRTILYQKKQ